MSNHIYTGSRREQIIESESDSLATIDQSIRESDSFPGERDVATSNRNATGSGREKLSRRHRKNHNLCNCFNVLPSNEEPSKWDRHIFVSRVHSLQDKQQHVCEDRQETSTTGDLSLTEKLAIPDASPNHLEDTRNTKTDFKTLLMMFLERSSIYALNQIGNSATTRRRVFWVFIMIVGLLGSFIQIIQFLSSYYSYPVVVNIDSDSQLNLQFPAVTICNMNNIQKKFLPCLKEGRTYHNCNTSAFAEDYNLDLRYEDDLDSDDNCRETLEKVSKSRIEQFLWRNLITLQSEEDRLAYGHQVSDFIHSCSFNGEKCGHEDFYHFVNPEYGNCFTFNTAFHNKTTLNTSFVGPNGGLELELDVEVKKYAYYTRAIGARVQVHDPAEFPDVTQRGVNVSPGFETSITLKRYRMKRLKAPYKDECKIYEVGDSMRFCLDNCTKKSVYNQCSCFVERNSFDARHCDFSKLSDLCCLFTIKNVEDECQCPLSCLDTDYLINIFNAAWPSMPYNRANPINKTDEDESIDYPIGPSEPMTLHDVRQTRLKVKVYYDTLETTTYRQSGKYQNAELFSQIGGQMGLWLGLSLIALFECIENIFLLWQYRTKQQLQNARNH